MAHGAIGLRIEDLDSPALLLDQEVSDRNLHRMAEFFRDRTCQLRPHFKNHKCTTLARRQLDVGSAVGVTCAKLGEAEVLADHGFDEALIANQVIGSRKIRRLTELAKKMNVKVAVDHIDQIESLSQAAASADVSIGVFVEVDIGMGRCGAKPGEPSLELARQIVSRPALRFEGLQAYEGHTVYIDDYDKRRELTEHAMLQAVNTRKLIESKGIDVGVLSGGATGTYKITGEIEGMNELQAGSYATMDWRYHQVVPDFSIALSVLTHVISVRPNTAVLDVGLKGAGCEFGLPRIKDYPDVNIPFFGAEEHLVVNDTPRWSIGEAVQLISSHACTTCNLYRQMYVHKEGVVVDVWPIEASGKLC